MKRLHRLADQFDSLVPHRNNESRNIERRLRSISKSNRPFPETRTPAPRCCVRCRRMPGLDLSRFSSGCAFMVVIFRLSVSPLKRHLSTAVAPPEQVSLLRDFGDPDKPSKTAPSVGVCGDAREARFGALVGKNEIGCWSGTGGSEAEIGTAMVESGQYPAKPAKQKLRGSRWHRSSCGCAGNRDVRF